MATAYLTLVPRPGHRCEHTTREFQRHGLRRKEPWPEMNERVRRERLRPGVRSALCVGSIDLRSVDVRERVTRTSSGGRGRCGGATGVPRPGRAYGDSSGTAVSARGKRCCGNAGNRHGVACMIPSVKTRDSARRGPRTSAQWVCEDVGR
ncbi:hypothetical protein FKP32DRAFT_40826 [Trametes sanguinea]|nr:hypothetical protein FKP32DRAFT_40826 [Trametes sanguinea]